MSYTFLDDLVFYSDCGRYRLEIRSPFNGRISQPETRPSSRFDWCLKLFDAESLEWERWYTRQRLDPTKAWVSAFGVTVLVSNGVLEPGLVALSKTWDTQ